MIVRHLGRVRPGQGASFAFDGAGCYDIRDIFCFGGIKNE